MGNANAASPPPGPARTVGLEDGEAVATGGDAVVLLRVVELVLVVDAQQLSTLTCTSHCASLWEVRVVALTLLWTPSSLPPRSKNGAEL